MFPCDGGKLIVHHLSPMANGFSPPLLPFSFHSIPVHCASSFHFNYSSLKDYSIEKE
jgi:hypothetical protein